MDGKENQPHHPADKAAKTDSAPNQEPVLRLAFNVSKAGMDEPVKDSINAMITRDMKNPYFQRQVQKKRHNEKTVEGFKAKIEAVKSSPQLEQQLRREFETQVRDIDRQLDLSRHWVHVDLDMFFVAVEIRDNPALRDAPVAVGTPCSPRKPQSCIAQRFPAGSSAMGRLNWCGRDSRW